MTTTVDKTGAAAYHAKKCGLLLLFLVILIAGLFLSLLFGAVNLSVGDILRVLFLEQEGKYHVIIANVRLPRTIVAALSGMCLALSGVIMQGITRNPMSSPSVLGVSNGAALVTLILFVVYPNAFPYIPAASFAGALMTTLLIYFVAWKNGLEPVRFILSGVAVSTIFGALYDVIVTIYPDSISGMVGFMVGSLSARSWEHVSLILPYSIVGLVLSLLFSHKLNLLSMGEEVATSLGLRVEQTRLILIVVSSLLAGSAISVVGRIGFVGLCVPHITRMLIGTDFRYLIPATAINGASMLVICDTVARLVIAPKEIPVGIIMALLGAPFFLFLLRDQRGRRV